MGVGKYAAGVLIALCTTFVSAMGLAMQKKTHVRLELAREAARRRGGLVGAEKLKSLRSFRQPLWVAGLTLMILSSLTSLAVFALVGQAVASSFGAVTILWNLLFSTLWLGESVGLLDALVTVILIAGSIVAVIFGRKGRVSEGFYSPDEVQEVWSRTVAIVVGAIIGGIMVAAFALSYVIQKRRMKFGVGKGRRMVSQRLFQFSIVLRLVLAGLCSGWTGACAKGFISMLSWAIDNDNIGEVAGYVGFWLLLLFLFPSLYLQVFFLNSALKDGDATFVVPQYQAQLVAWGVLYGLVFYDEGSGKSTVDLIAFIAGVLLIVGGIALLMFKRPHNLGAKGAAEATQLLLLDLADAVDALLRAHAPLAQALRRTVSAPAATHHYKALGLMMLIEPADILLAPNEPQQAAGQETGQHNGESLVMHALSSGQAPILGPSLVLPVSRPHAAGSLSRDYKVVLELANEGQAGPQEVEQGRAIQGSHSEGMVRSVPAPLTFLQSVSEEALRSEWPPVDPSAPARTCAAQGNDGAHAGTAAGTGLDVHGIEDNADGPHHRRRSSSTFLAQEGSAVAPTVAMKVQLPAVPIMMSDPARDARYRRTMAAARVSRLYPAVPKAPMQHPPRRTRQSERIQDTELAHVQPAQPPARTVMEKVRGWLPRWARAGIADVHVPGKSARDCQSPVVAGEDVKEPQPIQEAHHEAHAVPLPAMDLDTLPHRAEVLPVILVPPSLVIPVAIVRAMSVSPSLLAAVLRARPSRSGSAAERSRNDGWISMEQHRS